MLMQENSAIPIAVTFNNSQIVSVKGRIIKIKQVGLCWKNVEGVMWGLKKYNIAQQIEQR